MSLKDLVANSNDDEKAEMLECILAENLGPKALDVQTKHIASCAREFAVVDAMNRVLLFWRPGGVRYACSYHISGTTVNKAKLMCKTGLTPFEFVRKKYKLHNVALGNPEFVGFVEISEGPGPDQCEFGEVWTQLHCVRYRGGIIPCSAVWSPVDPPVEGTMAYHRDVLLKMLSKYLSK